MNIEDIQIKIFPAKAKSETMAYVNLEFPFEIDGLPSPISIAGFRIMTDHFQRHGSYRVLPPQLISPGRKPRDIFFLNNTELWFKLQSRILAEYEKLARELYFKQNETS